MQPEPAPEPQAPAPLEGRCGARCRTGGTCRNWPLPGQTRCRMHGAKTPRALAAAARRLEAAEARAAVATYGLPIEIDPLDALLGELHRTAGHVAWLAGIVADLDEGAGRDGLMVDTMVGKQPSHWLQLYRQERSHLAGVARACLAAGVEERRVKLAEQQAELVAEAFRGFARELGHDPADPAVRQAFRRHLTAVSSAAA